MTSSVAIDCERCGVRFLSSGETKCITCIAEEIDKAEEKAEREKTLLELADNLDTTPKELVDFAVDQVVGRREKDAK